MLDTIIHPPAGLKYEGNDNLEENSKQIFSDSLHPDRSVHIGSQIQVAASNIYVKYPTGEISQSFFAFHSWLLNYTLILSIDATNLQKNSQMKIFAHM